MHYTSRAYILFFSLAVTLVVRDCRPSDPEFVDASNRPLVDAMYRTILTDAAWHSCDTYVGQQLHVLPPLPVHLSHMIRAVDLLMPETKLKSILESAYQLCKRSLETVVLDVQSPHALSLEQQQYQLFGMALLVKSIPLITLSIRKEIITILNTLDEHLYYWTMQSRHQLYYLFHKPPAKFVERKTQQQDIDENIQLIYRMQQYYFHLLGRFDRLLHDMSTHTPLTMQHAWVDSVFEIAETVVFGKPSVLTYPDAPISMQEDVLLKRATRIVSNFGSMNVRLNTLIARVAIPCHFKRHWLAYTGVVLCASALGLYACTNPDRVKTSYEKFKGHTRELFDYGKVSLLRVWRLFVPERKVKSEPLMTLEQLEDLLGQFKDDPGLTDDLKSSLRASLDTRSFKPWLDLCLLAFAKDSNESWFGKIGAVKNAFTNNSLSRRTCVDGAGLLLGQGQQWLQKTDEKVSLLFALVGTITIGVGAYKILNLLYHVLKPRAHDFEPLRTALVNIERLLIKLEETGGVIDDIHWGRLLHALNRVEQEVPFVQDPDRWQFEHDARDLASPLLSVRYKLGLIQNMFRRYTCIHQAGVAVHA